MGTDARMDVEWVTTEHGIVNLRGKSTKQRAEALIGLADPKFHDELTAAAHRICRPCRPTPPRCANSTT
jgi:itaconate CoA-transferase